jgi:hypothetical protein
VALCDKYNSQNKDGRITKEEKDQKQDIKPVIIVDCKVICFNSTILYSVVCGALFIAMGRLKLHQLFKYMSNKADTDDKR